MAGEVFNYQKIATAINTLNGYNESYATALSNMDTEVNVVLNVASTSAVYGEAAKKLVDLWNDKCAILKNYKGVFDEWLSLINEVAQNNSGFEGNYQYGEKGNSLTFTTTENEATSYTGAQIMAALLAGSSTIGGVPIQGEDLGNGQMKVTVDGKEFIVTKDADGNVISYTDTTSNTTYTISNTPFEATAQSIYDAYRNGNMTNSEWNDFVNSLNAEQKAILSNVQNGVYKIDLGDPFKADETGAVTVQGAISLLQGEDNGFSTQTIDSYKDFNQGELDGHTIYVADAEQVEATWVDTYVTGDEWQRAGDTVYHSVEAVRNNINNEATYLDGLVTQVENSATYKSMSSEDQTALMSFLTAQAQERRTLGEDMGKATQTGFFVTDGAIGDVSTKSAVVGGYSGKEAYQKSVDVAQGFQTRLDGLSSVSSINDMLDSLGFDL